MWSGTRMIVQLTKQRQHCCLSVLLLLLVCSEVLQVCNSQDIAGTDTDSVLGQPLATTCPLLYTRSFIPMSNTKMNYVYYRYGVNTIDSTVSFEITHVGLGYIGFGLSTTGSMLNATTIVGDFQQDPPSMTMTSATIITGEVYQYIMRGYEVDETYLLMDSNAYEGLTVKTVQQNFTHTVLSITRTFLSAIGQTYGEVDFIPSIENKFIWAIGMYNKMNTTYIDHGYETIPTSSNPNDVSCMLDTTISTRPVMSNVAGMTVMARTVPDVSVVRISDNGSSTVEVDQYDCSLTNVPPLMISDDTIAVRGIVHPIQNTITVEMVYNKLVYLSFGFSATGRMYPATVAIGLPGIEQSSLKYTMSGYDEGRIIAIPTPAPYGSVTQNTTHTTLTMTRTLIEEDPTILGGTNVNISVDNNRFIWCIGSANTLTYHPKFGTAILPLANIGTCTAAPIGVTTPTTQPTATTVPTTVSPIDAPAPISAPVSVPQAVPAPMMAPVSVPQAVPAPMMAPVSVPQAVPAAVPVAIPVTIPVPVTPTSPVVADQYDCSLTSVPSLMISDDTIAIKGIVHPKQNTITVEMVHTGLVYLSFGFSTTGKMYPATVAIGTPGIVQSSFKYTMSSYAQSSILAVATPTPYGTITQNTTHTTLTMTRTLIEEDMTVLGATNVDLTTDNNKFIWAIGSSNTLSMHPKFGTAILPLANIGTCKALPPGVTAPTQQPKAPTTPVALPIAAPIAGPAMAPVPAPVTVPVPATPTSPVVGEQYDCSLTNVPPLMISDDAIAIKGIVHPKQNTITVEMVHTGLVYLSFGFSTSGKMYPATVAIGTPGTVQSSFKYTMSSYAQSSILAVATLTPYGTITQNTTHTTLTMTRTLIEEDMTILGATNVDLTSDNNRFIWAIGSSNALSYHPKYGSAILPLANIGTCKALPIGVTAPTQQPQAPTAPVVVPVAVPAPVTVPIPVTPTSPVVGVVYDCSLTNVPPLMISDNTIAVRGIVHPIECTIKVEMVHTGLVYLSFGFSTSGKMYPATVAIGTPGIEQSSLKYTMSGYGQDSILAVPTPTPYGTITQNTTHTTLTMTRALIEENTTTLGATNVNVTVDDNRFIWAIGSTNALAMHPKFGSTILPLANIGTCKALPAGVTAPTQQPQAPTAPVVAPVAVPAPVTVPVPATSTSPVVGDQYDCSLANVQPLMISDNTIAIRGIVHPTQNTIKVEMVHTGLVYLSFGFSTSGKMYPATVAIGTPGTEQLSLKYTMSGYAEESILTVPTPTPYGSITQNTTHTTLTMTRALIEEDMTILGATNVDLTSDNNRFIWAIGSSNALSYHPKYGSAILPLANIGTCVALPEGATAPSQQPIAVAALAPGGVVNNTESNVLTADSDELGKVLFPNLFLKVVPSTDEKYIEVVLTHKHDGVKPGYLSLAVSESGKMYPAVAIVGSDDNEKPMKYFMSGYGMSDVTLLPTDQQTLVESTFVTDDTQSVLTYKQLVAENKPNEQNIAISEDTTFIYAIGITPTIGNHGMQRGSFTCNPKEGTCSSGAVKKAVSRETVWLVHGIFMVIAWVLLIPSAIGASILRSLLPVGPLWFQVHKNLNQLGIILTILGFIMSFIVVQLEGKTHFTLNSHYKIGLVIFIFAVFQALNGMYKPPAPAPPVPPPILDTATKVLSIDDDDNDDDDEPEIEAPGATIPADSISSRTSQQQSPTVQMPKKSFARLCWEIYHRILGFALIGISWYNCDTGFKLYQQRYEDNYIPALWGIIGGICSLFVILYTYTRMK